MGKWKLSAPLQKQRTLKHGFSITTGMFINQAAAIALRGLGITNYLELEMMQTEIVKVLSKK